MNGQGNYKTQVGQGPYVPPPAFVLHHGAAPAPAPAPVTPLTFHHGPLETQPQVIRPGNPSFPLPPGSVPYTHVLSGTSLQGPDTPVLSSGMNSGQSYLIHPHFPQTQGSTQSSHSYPTYGPQRFAWSQNVHQIPPTGSLPTPRAYLPPSSQGYPMERGLPLQPPSQHTPPPPPPPYSSSSSFSTADPFGSTVHSVTQHSYVHSMRLLPPPPPPPPPPPLPPSSPPGVPPLPPSSPPSDNLSNNDGSHNSKEDLLEGSNLMLRHHPHRMKPTKDKSVHDVGFTCQSTEIEPEVETTTHSPADSDMDMEDDITQPGEEKPSCVSKNFNDECVTLSKDVAKEQLQASQHTGGHRLPKVALDGSLLNAGSSVLQDQRLGSEIPSTCDPVTGRIHSESNHSENSGAKLSNQLGGANSFKLLQGYTSDDSSENEVGMLLGDVSHPSVKVGSMNFSAEKDCSFVSEIESSKYMTSKSMIESSRIANEDDGKTCFVTGKAEFADKSLGDQESVKDVTYTALQSKDSLRSSGGDIDLEGGNFEKPDIKSVRAKLNVDEFGRLVREGASDSDTSDTPRYTRRHGRRGRKRSRSQSRSRSPHDRRRRSPSRRKERRHQSRSLSPKRQRSRSKSPISRRGIEFIGDRLRREKGQLPECFDFLRGKCYRGATCRYLHLESDKNERLRYNRDKRQHQDMPPTLRTPDYHADRISEKKLVLENKEAKDKGPKPLQDMPGVEELKNAKELPVDPTSRFPNKLNYLQSAAPQVADVVARNLPCYSSHDMDSGNENSLIQESPAKISDKNPQLVHQQSKQLANSLISESSSLVQTSAAISTHFPADKPDKEEDPIGQPFSVRSPTTKSYSVEDVPSHSLNSKDFSASISHHPSQLPPSLPPVSQVVSAQLGQGISSDYSLMQSTAQFHLKTENYSPYHALVSYQYSHIPKPTNSSSSFLPPPKPLHSHVTVNVATGEHNLLSQQHTQQSLLPPRNGLSSYTSMRPHPSELHTQSQIGQYQAYTSALEPDQMPHKMDDIRSSSLHANNKMSQQGGSHVLGEGSGHPVQGMNSLQSFSQALSKSFHMQSPPKGMHASLLGSLSSNSDPSLSHPYLQQDYYGLKYSVADGVSAKLGEPGKLSTSISRVAPDFIERNQPSCVPDFVGSRVSIHFNPYASTFDQPLSSQFSSNALTKEKDTQFNTKYGPPLSLISVPVHGHNVGSVSLTNMISSSTSARTAVGVLPRPGGDQYDPLFDSIEPASNSFRSDCQKHEITDDSDDIPKFNGSSKKLNMDGIKQEEAAAVSANDSLEIEEYGETADAEVGAVVSGSPVNPHNTTEMNPEEFEIDQVKASGKNKKGKDTRSMKLFKISIATFVKEVLKPSWRQGNMSKEAFKTIVKKTVDKVSSAMKSHRIPKSQAKINHYIDSSRGKLTKLVMGYVDKYVKV